MAITIVSSLPTHISPEEHKTISASTPASFADIPPVLRHKEDNVSVTLDPPLEGFSAEDGANGTLYVIESVLGFISTTGKGFQVDYPSITLHAISRAEAGPSIYCQLDDPSTDEAAAAGEEEEDVVNMRELVIVPKQSSALEPIFESLSFCASLHPDPNEADDMDDDDDAFVDPGEFETFNGDEDQELSEVGKAALAHIESIIYNPYEPKEEQFEDAEEDHTDDAVHPSEKSKGDVPEKDGQSSS